MEINLNEPNDVSNWLDFKHDIGIEEGQEYDPKLKELFFKYKDLPIEKIKEKIGTAYWRREVNLDQEPKKVEEEIINEPPQFNIIEYELYGKRYKLDVSPLLTITNKGLESATDMEIDDHLEKIAAYRHSIATLKAAISGEFVKAQEAYDRWQAEKWMEVNQIALLRRKQLKEDTGGLGGWSGSITKEELKGILMTQFAEHYSQYNHNIAKYKMMDKVIGNLLSVLEDRGSQVQTIVRRRQGLRREV